MSVRVLVSAASKHGATAEIATRIAEALRAGLPPDAVVDVCPAADADDVTSYDALVLGSGIYMGRWLEDAREAVVRIAKQEARPVWLFSSGPVGDPPKTGEPSVDVSDIAVTLAAREHRLFAGRLDRQLLGFAERALVLALRVADGDFRDWDAIDAWGAQIATELTGATVS